NYSDSMQTGSSDAFLENRIKRLLAERKKIEAVKAYREAYNCGLKEAKDAVDAIEIQMRMGGYSSMPSTSTVSNDPFAEEAVGNRRRLIIFVTLLLIAFSVFIIFFVLR
ncbi:MAG: ribosomal protein L7/L12, partial [Anaerolineales bacterium]